MSHNSMPVCQVSDAQLIRDLAQLPRRSDPIHCFAIPAALTRGMGYQYIMPGHKFISLSTAIRGLVLSVKWAQ